MKRFLIISIPTVAIVAALIGISAVGLLPRGTLFDYFSPKDRFIRYWSATLRNCYDASAAEAVLKQNKEGGHAFVMADGSWVAVVMEHHCCTGAGFDATLYVTSSRDTFLDSDSTYCGWFPLGEELTVYPTDTAHSFIQAAQTNGKDLTRL